MRFSFVTLALATLGSVSADVYMHNMRASNNRLDEANRDRANGNRVFDSQNNNRGGYNVGNLYYYEGSELDLTWTNQHACGDHRSMCEVIIQYMCDPLLRDGTVTNTIPTDNNQCYNNNCDTDITFGRHESQQYYADCRYRKRNTGLFTASQNLNGMGAQYTRQNPSGDRHGYECPEERDYYPYWAPSPWRDVAILTNFPERCESYKAESQNVKSRFYCWISQPLKDLLAKKQGGNPWGVAPIEKAACEAVTGTLTDGQVLRGIWMEVPAFGIPAPYCGKSQWTRDNHLGNTIGGFPPGFNWTIPALSSMPGVDANRCVLRVRYNITTGDFGDATRPLASGAGVFASSTSALVGNVTSLYNRKVPAGQPANQANRYPASNDIWSKYGLNYAAVSDSFQTATNDPEKAEARRNTREYVVKNNPNVDFFGTLLPAGARGLVKTQLAINTAQYGRTFQDRSHRFAIRPAPAGIAGQSIHNLNVQGKRGNIVQVYPGVEYDFTPYRLHVPLGEYIHVQWTGSNTNPGNNAGQGVAGSDRHNMMMLVPKKFDEGQKLTTPTTYGQWGTVYPNRIDTKRTGAPAEQTLLGITDPMTLQHLAVLDQPGGQFGGSMDELNDAGTYFDGGLIRASVLGIYHYLCTRNNNFSNRDQKGKIVISTEKVKTLSLDSNAFFYSTPMGVTGVDSGGTGKAASIYVPASNGRDLSRFTWAEYPSSLSTSLSDVSSSYVQLSGIEGHGATLTLPYDGSALSISTVYYAPSIEGPWSSTDASMSNDQASVIASRDGVYVVQTKLNAGAVAGIVIGSVAFVALLITITVCMYRRRTGRGKVDQVATHNAV